MPSFLRWSLPTLGAVALAGWAAAQEARPPTVNQFTAPPIDQLLQRATALQPIPFDKVWREPPGRAPQERPRLALETGGNIADAFLVVACERKSRVDPVGRALLRCSKALGFGDRISARSRHILEAAEKDRWAEVRRELLKTQGEAEDALRALHDDDLGQLLALGGWLRGLEITSCCVADRYTPERARLLDQPELAIYFLARLDALSPRLRAMPLVQKLTHLLRGIRSLIERGDDRPLNEHEVQKLLLLAKTANDAILLEP